MKAARPSCRTLVALGVLLWITATTFSAADETSGIAGRVTGLGGVPPLSGVTVSAYRWDGSRWEWVRSAVTDSEGAYLLSVGPGTYRVGFSDTAGRYLDEFYHDAPALNVATDIEVLEGVVTSGIDAALAASSGISGRVTARLSGLPLEGILALAFQWDGTSWQQVWSSSTDGQGDYSIPLSAGTYRVGFLDTRGLYAPEFYDDVGSVDEAANIEVPEQVMVTGIHASLAAYGKMLGTVVAGDDLAPLNLIRVLAYRWDGAAWVTTSPVWTSALGEYALEKLTAGTYRIRFEDPAGVYAAEYYDDAWDFAMAADIVVAEGAAISGLNAALAKRTPPRIIGFRMPASGEWDILFTANAGVACTLQGATSLEKDWQDLEGPVISQGGTNLIRRAEASPLTFYRVRE